MGKGLVGVTTGLFLQLNLENILICKRFLLTESFCTLIIIFRDDNSFVRADQIFEGIFFSEIMKAVSSK